MSRTTGIRGLTFPHLIRRQAAEVRQRDRATRSADTQLALLNSRPGRSARERARLEAQR